MNLVTTNSDQLTMSSREISAVTNVRHDNVKRTMETLQQKGLITFTQSEEKGNGRPAVVFHVNKRDSYVLVAQLSPEFTAKLVDRWQELEEQQIPQLPDFNNPAESARAWADQYEQNQIKQKQLELAAPKVAFVDNLVERANLLTATQVAQKHKKSAIWLNKFLSEMKVYNRAVKRGKVFQQWFVDKGYGEMKKNDMGYDQPLFTNAGEVWVNEQLFSEGVL